jgi:hypothetical protein
MLARNRYNLYHILIAILLLIVLALACGEFNPGGNPTPLAQEPTSTNESANTEAADPNTQTLVLEATATPTPTATPTILAAGLVIGKANLVYTFHVLDGDVLVGEGENTIPLHIKSIGDEGHYIYTEDLPGTQVVRIAGGTAQAIVCYITYTFTTTYSIDGDFYEDGCRFEFNFENFSETLEVEETGNSCGFSVSGSHLFFPPPFGPHIITEYSNPLTIKPDPRVTHIFSIEDVELPTSITCW